MRRESSAANGDRRQVNVATDREKADLLSKICEMKGITLVQVFDGFLDKVIADNAPAIREGIIQDEADRRTRAAEEIAYLDAIIEAE